MEKAELGRLLLVVSGSATDATLIIGFGVLTAAQTGNTILLAAALARGDIGTGLSSAISIAAFVLGAVTGALFCRHRGPRMALAAELGLLLCALCVGLATGAPPGALEGNFLVGLAAAAMGVQSAVVVRSGGYPSTYITGLLTGFSIGLVGGRSAAGASHGLLGLVWLLYLSGAILAGWLCVSLGEAGFLALVVPLLALACALPLTSSRPTAWDPRLDHAEMPGLDGGC
jgi:uncharacterized membrane protein YoaK (UPF0700 family)